MNEEEDQYMRTGLGPGFEDIDNSKIVVDGKEIKIQSAEECNKADYWVCRRVVAGPSGLARSQIDKCTRCGEDVWFDPGMGITDPPKVCVECMLNTVQHERVVKE